MRFQRGRVWRHPLEGNLVSREESAQVGTRGIPALPEYRDTRLGRFCSNPLETPDALARERADLQRDLGRRGGNGVVLLDLNPHDARGFCRPIATREG